ncbi:MAG: hypothetical protein JKY37_33005 [Nannocystaceae bacterium]|nr:hypothetical protein [Nannocystaceae bacterium]
MSDTSEPNPATTEFRDEAITSARTMGKDDHGTLYEYGTGDKIRPATAEELAKSRALGTRWRGVCKSSSMAPAGRGRFSLRPVSAN